MKQPDSRTPATARPGNGRSRPARGDVDRRMLERIRAAAAIVRIRQEALYDRLAGHFNLDPLAARTAGWLHDVSAVIGTEWLGAAAELEVEVLPAELVYPNLLHQKISAVMARQIFGVTDPAVLSAIGCHTTLRPAASRLDLALFVADKLRWDQPGQPPYAADMSAALQGSLERAAWVYLDYLWQRRAELVILHPWAEAAWRALK